MAAAQAKVVQTDPLKHTLPAATFQLHSDIGTVQSSVQSLLYRCTHSSEQRERQSYNVNCPIENETP
jgi:hypothetical protein